jgi:superfamily II DNA helicase RecQ
MQIRLFQFPLPADPEMVELNQFLASHRVVSVHRETVVTSNGPLLLFVVQYLSAMPANSRPGGTGEAIDYREVLNEHDFNVFCLLRNQRKQLADGDGTAVFKIFSNAHLAAMIQNRCLDLVSMRKIPGLSEAKLQKYGEPMVRILREQYRIEANPASAQSPPAANPANPF